MSLENPVLNAMLSRLEALRSVRVGVLESKGGNEPHPVENADGTPGSSTITMVELAAIHEFGSPAANIPERSFLRRTFAARNPELQVLMGRLAKGIIAGKIGPEQAAHLLGQWSVAQVRKTITSEHIPPPLQPATIARKGSDRPLVDTGRLLGAINYEIDSAGAGTSVSPGQVPE
jgi:hypothetical protein